MKHLETYSNKDHSTRHIMLGDKDRSTSLCQWAYKSRYYRSAHIYGRPLCKNCVRSINALIKRGEFPDGLFLHEGPIVT